MANVFQLTNLVARDAAIELHGAINAAQLVGGAVEEKFARKVGDEIHVKTRPIMSANRHYGSGSFSNSDISETKVAIPILHRAYVKHTLTGEEMQFSVDDFALQVTRPAMLALAKDVDSVVIDQLVRGFARNAVGTDGASPSTLAHLAAGYKALFDNECPMQNLAGVIDSTAMAAFLQLPQFTNRDYGEDRPRGIREAVVSRLYDIDFYPNQRAGSLDQGDVAGTVLVDGAGFVIGNTTIHLDGFTATTGYVHQGTRFTIAGDTTVYTVKARSTANSGKANRYDHPIASNEGDVEIYPALVANAADGTAITFKSALTENPIFSRFGAAKGIIAPMPQRGNPSAVGSFEGMSVRTTFESSINDSTSGDSEAVLFDVFIACEVIVPAAGIVLQG